MTKYLFPRTWLGRVIVAWLGGLVLALPVTLLTNLEYFVAAFWSLVALLAGFAASDLRRSRRTPDSPE